MRDKDRERQKSGISIVKGKELPWEINRHGKFRWYLHPSIDDTVTRAMILSVQEIPPRSRSGQMKFPGGQVIYIMKGRGYTLLDGVKHHWQAGDVVQLPLRTNGVVFQHFNEDSNPVQLIAVQPNVVDALGVDLGSEFEQIENCPEYEEIKP
jgi:gentisate 1,2-dioxygenase